MIRYNVRGHGTAGGCAMADSYDVLADDLLAVLDRLALDRAHVVGHSRWFTPSALAAVAPDDEAAVVSYVRTCLAGVDAETYAGALELIAGFDVLARLAELELPTRFLAAERDPVSGPQALRSSAEATPGAELVVFADAVAPAAARAPATRHGVACGEPDLPATDRCAGSG